MIEIEDLDGSKFFIVCYENKNKGENSLYIWKGNSVKLEENEYNEFIEDVKKNFFQKETIEQNQIIIIDEIPFNESDEFLDFLI